ncbi:hypothetical protein [Promicromonospora soli]
MTRSDPRSDHDSGSLVTATWDLGGAVIAAAVNPTGTTDLWVLAPGAAEGRWQIPDHEHLGPLPHQVARRTAQVLAHSTTNHRTERTS